MQLLDQRGRSIRLGPKLGEGGEGAVFEIDGDAQRVAKLYLPKVSVTPDRVEKLEALVASFSPDIGKVAAWPDSVLRNAGNGAVVGFTMPRISGFKDIHLLYGPGTRRKLFASADWSFLVHTAMNVASAVEAVHALGHVVGDVNSRNILVSDRALVRLIDCDSFAVTRNGKTFPCLVGVPEFTPPELQGVNFASVARTADHDLFGLAVMVFQLLFLGRHPFFGVQPRGATPVSLPSSIKQRQFAYDPAAAARGVSPPPMTLPLHAVPVELARLFEQAFLKQAGGSPRPSATQWRTVLRVMSSGMQVCGLESGHRFPAHLADCPWCGLVQTAGVDFFPGSTVRVLDFVSDPKDIAALWADIERYAIIAGVHLSKRAPLPLQPAPPQAAIARAKLRASERPVTRMAWVTAAAALPTLLTPFAWIGVALAAVITAMLFTRVLQARASDPLVLVRQDAQARARTAGSQLNELEARMYARAATARGRLTPIVTAARQARDAYFGLKQRHDERLAKLELGRFDSQRIEFLRSTLIEDATIDKIGAGRKRSLVGYGIESAYDVLSADLSIVQGFGPALRDNLRIWANGIAARFVYDPKRGLSDVERHNVALTSKREQNALRANLESAAKAARQVQDDTSAELATALERAQQQQAECQRLDADADAFVRADVTLEDGPLTHVSAEARAAFAVAAENVQARFGVAPDLLTTCVTSHHAYVQRYARAGHAIARREVVLKTAPSASGVIGSLPSPTTVDPWTASPATLPNTSRVACRCPQCTGNGRVACGDCSGSGRANCLRCRGSGRVSSNRRPYSKNCPACRGRGDERCVRCSNGLVGCSTCSSSGQVTAWLEVIETRSGLVLHHPPTARELHPQIEDHRDFDNSDGFTNRLVSDTTLGPTGPLPAELVPRLDSRHERRVSTRLQEFESHVHRFAYRVAARDGVLEVAGDKPTVSLGSTYRPLERRRQGIWLARTFGMLAVAGAVAAHLALNPGINPISSVPIALVGLVMVVLFSAWVGVATFGRSVRSRLSTRVRGAAAVLATVATASATVTTSAARPNAEPAAATLANAETKPVVDTPDVAAQTEVAAADAASANSSVEEKLAATAPSTGRTADAERSYQNAVKSLRGGDVATARRLLDEAVAADPTHVNARFTRAQVCAGQGDIEVGLDNLIALKLIGTSNSKWALKRVAIEKEFARLRADARFKAITAPER